MGNSRRFQVKDLAALPGRYKFYGVVSEKMRLRAQTKAKAYKITVILLLEREMAEKAPGAVSQPGRQG